MDYENIKKYRKLSENGNLTLDERYLYAQKAVELSRKMNIDSVILRSNRIISTIYLFKDDYNSYRKINYQNLKLSKSLKDSLAIGIAHHNLGWYHHHSKVQNDSAYYYYSTAVKIYDEIGEISRQIGVLTNLSGIQFIEKDFLGSEESAIKGLQLLQQSPQTEANLEAAWNFYNNLANVSLELNNYSKSIEYNRKASEIADEMADGFLLKLVSKNNIAFVYKEKGEIATAYELYNDIYENYDFFDIDPTFYALVLDNVTYASFLNNDRNFNKLEKNFKRAYKICDSMNDPITKMAVTIDLAKFYKSQNKVDSSLRYAQETYKLSKETSSNDMLLESLLVLSQLNSGEKGKKYLNEHIRLSDSLLQHERGIRNKFARVQFETDQIERENERIATQRFWLLMVSIGLLLTLFLLYIIITQRAKNKELQFEKEQQQANEEIYNLMLSQQDKVDEARANEKMRISEELHDGILGRLFGTRLSLGSLNYNDSKEAIQKRMAYIDDLQSIESDIRKISHDLNTDFVAGSGFMDIVETLIYNQTQAYQLTYDFYHSDDINWEEITNKSKIHIYRILQETMQNSYKHAEASHIKISFHLKNSVIWLTISDDGKGFEINKSKKGIGLKNINSRVEEVGGTVQFESSTDSGTTITIQIPYSK